MNLSAPQVTGPVSVCSDSVRIKGQITGSIVSVLLNGDADNPIAEADANWSDQVFSLTDLPADGLQSGDELTAIQTLGVDESSQSPEPVVVQPFEPGDLNHISFKSHLYECGRHLWFHGLVPGATLEVGQGGTRGSAKSVDGNARLTIDPPLSAGENLLVRQVACGETGPDVFGIEPDPTDQFTTDRGLPAPRIGNPAYACDRSVLVTDVIDGSDVTLNREAFGSRTSGFDLDTLAFGIHSEPLEEGEKLSVSQAMPDCDLNSNESAPKVTVRPAEDASAPGIADPLCEKSTAVLVFRLNPGSKVRILKDGTELVVGEAPNSTFAFSVPPLEAGAKITAQQERCDIWSAESSPVTVGDAPADISPPQIAANPLHECATVIPVKNLHRGSWVRAFSSRLGQISPTIYVNTTEATISVSPALAADDEVFIEQTGCGGSRIESSRVSVQSEPPLNPPRIGKPVTSRDTALEVNDIVPGAVVEVYRRRQRSSNIQFVKAVNPGVSKTIVRIGELTVGDRYDVRQILCNSATSLRRDREVEVQRPRPYPPVELRPNGRITSLQPTLHWEDPHKNRADWKADSFDLEITVDGNSTFSDNLTSSSHSISSDLPFSADVEWRVRGVNPSGTSTWSEASFDVEAEPDPEGPSKVHIWNCNNDRRALHIWLHDSTDNSITEVATLDDQYGGGSGCPASGETPFEITLTSDHSYALVAVDPQLNGCGVNDPANEFCYRLYPVLFKGDSQGGIMNITIQ